MSAAMNLKPLRDVLVQVLATVMIPLTVAGVGWYYTRWQQNLNDLRTMIDLVTDDRSERRKYGIAMFEYLIKNDKVPVEFMAAQLDFANSSNDRELLPLLEAAFHKAARENPAVAAAFREALVRLPSRLFVHVADEAQRPCARALLASLKDIDKSTITVPVIAQASWRGQTHELRVLNDADLGRAKILAGLFEGAGLEVKIVNLSNVWDGAKNIRPNTFELWLADVPLPLACQKATAGM